MGIIALLITLLPLVEIGGFVVIGPMLGLAGTIAFVILSALIGVMTMRYAGFVTLDRLRDSLRRGEEPVLDVLDGFVLLVAALLLIMPGFFSSAAGLLLLVPPVRSLVAGQIAGRLDRGPLIRRVFRPEAGTRGPQTVIDVDFQEIDPPSPPDLPPPTRRR